MGSGLRVRFWGTRGSGPAPFGDRLKYGGNTSCVSAAFDGGLAVFDAGTGIIALGRFLEESSRQGIWDPAVPVHIFIGHVHLDHIQGLMLFSWLFRKGAPIHLYGLANEEISFRQKVMNVCGPPYWPVSAGQVPADLTWHEIKGEETIRISEGVRIRTGKACHPNGGLLFRLESGSQSVVYGLDCELGETPGVSVRENPVWEQYREFAKDCGLLIFDAPYTKEEYPAFCGFGHSYWQQGIRMAKECHGSRLCISHHDWGRTDKELERLEQALKEQAAGTGIEAEFAKEGMCIVLPDRS